MLTEPGKEITWDKGVVRQEDVGVNMPRDMKMAALFGVRPA